MADGLNIGMETPSSSLSTTKESTPSVVFQPPKLKDVIEVINLMGTVAARVREDNSGDMGGGGGTAGAAAGTGQTGTSARDEAIANAPPVMVMQKKLVEHLEREVKTIERQTRSLKTSNARGSAYLLTELYRKIRRLKSLIGQIVHASAEMIKRFYISAFIDQQPLVVTGGSLAHTEE
jgi:hypothetical protein